MWRPFPSRIFLALFGPPGALASAWTFGRDRATRVPRDQQLTSSFLRRKVVKLANSLRFSGIRVVKSWRRECPKPLWGDVRRGWTPMETRHDYETIPPELRSAISNSYRLLSSGEIPAQDLGNRSVVGSWLTRSMAVPRGPRSECSLLFSFFLVCPLKRNMFPNFSSTLSLRPANQPGPRLPPV